MSTPPPTVHGVYGHTTTAMHDHEYTPSPPFASRRHRQKKRPNKRPSAQRARSLRCTQMGTEAGEIKVKENNDVRGWNLTQVKPKPGRTPTQGDGNLMRARPKVGRTTRRWDGNLRQSEPRPSGERRRGDGNLMRA